MIVDSIKNAELYYALTPRIKQAFDWLASVNVKTLNVGRHDIDGDDLFVNVQDIELKPRYDAALEVHNKYIDIQVIISGEEKIYMPALEEPAVTKEFDEARDCAIFAMADPATCICSTLNEGDFAIFLPYEIHAPNLAARECVPVRKAVVKILY